MKCTKMYLQVKDTSFSSRGNDEVKHSTKDQVKKKLRGWPRGVPRKYKTASNKDTQAISASSKDKINKVIFRLFIVNKNCLSISFFVIFSSI